MRQPVAIYQLRCVLLALPGLASCVHAEAVALLLDTLVQVCLRARGLERAKTSVERHRRWVPSHRGTVCGRRWWWWWGGDAHAAHLRVIRHGTNAATRHCPVADFPDASGHLVLVDPRPVAARVPLGRLLLCHNRLLAAHSRTIQAPNTAAGCCCSRSSSGAAATRLHTRPPAGICTP